MRRNAGFTLVELLVALTLGALVTLMAHRLVIGVLDGVARAAGARVEGDRKANARRVLTALIGSIDIGRHGSGEFRGAPHGVAFSTWDVDEHGWPVRRRVTLASRTGTVTMRSGGREPVRLWEDVVRLDVDYLLAYGARERWVRTWISSASVPTALRLRIMRREASDTLLVVIGERG